MPVIVFIEPVAVHVVIAEVLSSGPLAKCHIILNPSDVVFLIASDVAVPFASKVKINLCQLEVIVNALVCWLAPFPEFI